MCPVYRSTVHSLLTFAAIPRLIRYMNKLIVLSVAAGLLFGCKKENSGPLSVSGNTTLNNNGFDQNRITYFWDQVQPFQKSQNDGITFFHVADVSSPVVNGTTCSATGMEISGNYCYVTYHINGSAYGGALEVFDISSPANPVLVSQLLLNDTDLNECTVANGKVYAIGGRNVSSSHFTENNTKGGVLLEVTLNNGLLTNTLRWKALPSFSGNSVNVAGNYIYAVSGSTGGGVFTLKTSDLSLVQADYFNNPKFCDIKNNQEGSAMLVLQGNPQAIIHSYTAGPNNIAGKTTYNILTQSVPADGKAVLHIDNNEVYVCTGANGLTAFGINNLGGAPVFSFNSPGNGNANGVDTDNEFIYVANGGEGTIIVNKDDHTIHSIFPFTGSANYVKAKSNYVFIANGKGGLKVLKRVNPALTSGPACASRPALTPAVFPWDYNINSGQSFAFQGSNVFSQSFNNNSIFYYCGSILTHNDFKCNSGSFTEIDGSLTVNRQLHINSGATLRIRGSVVVNGDFYLKGNLEFFGTGSTITVNGTVIRSPGYSVTGSYTSNVTL